MAWFKRSRRSRPSSGPAGPSSADMAVARVHLQDFAQTRVGVEMYVEPRTAVTPTTLVLIATNGEWTRRRIGSPQAAGQLARELAIPVYDVQQTGYPARMRAWTAAQRAAEKSAQQARDARKPQRPGNA